MAADSGRQRTAPAAQACVMCKTRKKKCNKALPSCGYCIRKELDCVYTRAPRLRHHGPPSVENRHAASIWGARPPMSIVSSRVVLSAKSPSDQTTAEDHQGQVYRQVHGIIRETRQFVDDISARYFQGFHRHLPVISRVHFYNNLVTSEAAPAADYSVLLLTICLITYAPALGYRSGNGVTQSVQQQTLYLTAKSLLAQVQVTCSPSVPLVQAGLLLAVYEYTHGRPDDAFVTIAGSARMAYATRIHDGGRYQTEMLQTADFNADRNLLLQVEEASNTWWGLVICERYISSEMATFDQPLLTAFPGGDARLPIESEVFDQLDISELQSLPNIPVFCLTSAKVGGFSRSAQASCLMDQVLKALDTPDIDSRLLLLDRLDTDIQAFLSLVMPQCPGQSGEYCAAVNIAIRALFILHSHILHQRPQAIRAKFKSLEEWHKASEKALDTATKMVVDIAETLVATSPATIATELVDAMPLIYPYIARAALRYITRNAPRDDEVEWLERAKDVLRASVDRYCERWGVGDDGIRLRTATEGGSAGLPILIEWSL